MQPHKGGYKHFMKSNSPFKAHGINHLSASSINQFVVSPAQFLGRIAGLSSTVGPAAWRGTASEQGIYAACADGNAMELALNAFDKEWLENGDHFDRVKLQKERDSIKNYVQHGAALYKTLGPIVEYQKKIVIDFDDLEIPFVGYVDFVFENAIRDTKTTARKPSSLSEANSRQLSIYAMAYPDYEVWVDYITPKEAVCYRLTNTEYYQKQVLKIAMGIRRFLSISDDIHELLAMIHPDLDHWHWNDDMKTQANKIWGYTND